MSAEPRAPILVRAFSTGFRARRAAVLRSFIERLAAEKGGLRILDLGGTNRYWAAVGMDFVQRLNLEITVTNLHASEITEPDTTNIKQVVADARAMASMADHSFDMVHSNSVIEHVGRWDDMVAFANEVRRLAPAYYVQTPYFWFPVDPHFPGLPMFHWLPAPARLALLRRFKIGWSPPTHDVHRAMARVESNVMLGGTQFRTLFPDGEHRFERAFGIPKSLIATRVA